jgi:dynein heavy chain, axonemal
MVKLIQREGGSFRKSGRYANFHKNLFFALLYFHALMAGRKDFGTVGWNLPYHYEIADFEVSSAQLSSLVKTLAPSRPASVPAALSLLNYYCAQINYGGKIQRHEDQALLEVMVAELVNERVSKFTQHPPDMSRGHFGYPPEALADHAGFLRKSIPDADPYEVYGLNANMARALLQKDAFKLIKILGDPSLMEK